MTEHDLLSAIGNVNDRDVADAARPRRKAPVWLKAMTTAACLCLVCMGAFVLLFGRMGAGAGGGGGNFVAGWYYYQVNGGDVYRHNMEQGSEKVLSGWRYDHWEVNENGLYYKQNRRLYLIDHNSGEKRLLYRSGLFESSHIGFTLYGEDVIVSVYNKRKDSVYEVLIDGKTGQELETLMPLTLNYDYWSQYSDLNYLVGSRHLTLVPAAGEQRYRHYLTEGGDKLSDVYVDIWPVYCDGGLWFNVYDEERYLVVYPEGEELLDLGRSRQDVADGYMYWYDYDQTQPPGVDIWTLLCMDVHSGEVWPLEIDTPNVPLEVLATDGEYMYSCFYTAQTVALWEIVYENGRPAGIRLLDEDINT